MISRKFSYAARLGLLVGGLATAALVPTPSMASETDSQKIIDYFTREDDCTGLEGSYPRVHLTRTLRPEFKGGTSLVVAGLVLYYREGQLPPDKNLEFDLSDLKLKDPEKSDGKVVIEVYADNILEKKPVGVVQWAGVERC